MHKPSLFQRTTKLNNFAKEYYEIDKKVIYRFNTTLRSIINVFLHFLQISSNIKRHIMYMIKTYIIKTQSPNIMHDNRLLTVPKIYFQMIPKNKDP